mmetsp:Transcript_18345/g.34083  ORF Transcript_18345/g.34083 Transcript_18345/m.34083 type:complete len:203 (-) Transcript_18345:42-650(-)
MDGAAEVEDFASKEPVEQGDGLLALVVCWDGQINVLKRRVRVAECNGWDAGVADLLDSLAVGPGVSDNEEAWLQELCSDLVGERARHPATRHGLCTDVLAELQHRPRTIRTLGRHDDVGGVLDGHDDARGSHELLPGLAQVNDVDAVNSATKNVALHTVITIACAQVGLAHQHHLNVFLFGSHSHCSNSDLEDGLSHNHTCT